MSQQRTKVLVRVAFLMALSVVITRFVVLMIPVAGGQKRLTFGYIPLMMTGYLYGPLWGLLAGIGADFIGVSIMPQGMFHIGFTLSSALTGLIPGLVKLLIPHDKPLTPRQDTGAMWLSTGLVVILVHVFLNTVWLSGLFGVPYKGLLIARTPFSLIEGVVGGILFILLVRLMQKLKHRSYA